MPHILTMTSEQYKNMFRTTNRRRTNTFSVRTHPSPPSFDALNVEAHLSPSLSTPNSKPLQYRNVLEEYIFIFIVMIATGATTFFLGVMVINTATIAKCLNMTITQAVWPLAAIGLASGAFTPFFGRTADAFGHKYQLLCGMAWLSVFSLATASASNSIALNIFCGCLGLSAASIFSPVMSTVLATYLEGRRRNRILGILGAANPIEFILGSMSSGVATSYWGWRASFYTISIFFLLMTILAFWSMPKMPRSGNTKMQIRQFDYLGTFLILAGVVLVSAGLLDGPELGWDSITVVVMLPLGLVCIMAFSVWEHFYIHPLLNPMVWKNRTFALSVLSTMFGYMSFISNIFWIPLYMHDVQKLAPLHIAVRLTPLAIAGILWSCLCQIFVNTVNGTIVMGIGVLAYVAGAILIFFVPESSSYWELLFPALSITAIGSSFQFTVVNSYITKHMPRQSSLAIGALQTVTRLSIPIGLAITTAVYRHQEISLLGRKDVNLSYSRAYLCSIIFAVIGLVFIPLTNLNPRSLKPTLEVSEPIPIPVEQEVEQKLPNNNEVLASCDPKNQASTTESTKIPSKPTDSGASTWSAATEGTVTKFDDSYFPRWSWEDNVRYEEGRIDRYQGGEIVYEVCINCREERKVVVDGSSLNYSLTESVGLGRQDLDAEKISGKRGGRLWIGGEWNRELDGEWYAKRGVKDGGSGWV